MTTCKRWSNSNSGGRDLVLFLGGVDDSAHEQHTAGCLLVDDEDEGSVDGQSGRKSGEHGGSTSCGDVIAALVDGHNGFMIHLKTRKQTVQWEIN